MQRVNVAAALMLVPAALHAAVVCGVDPLVPPAELVWCCDTGTDICRYDIWNGGVWLGGWADKGGVFLT